MDKPKKKISYEIPEDHWQAACKLAEKCGMSLSAYLRHTLKMHLERKGAV